VSVPTSDENKMRTENPAAYWIAVDERELGWVRCEYCRALIARTELEKSAGEISSCIVCGHQNQKIFKSASTGT
jgi:hypothetical protein